MSLWPDTATALSELRSAVLSDGPTDRQVRNWIRDGSIGIEPEQGPWTIHHAERPEDIPLVLDVACGTGIYVGFDATLANVSCTVSFR